MVTMHCPNTGAMTGCTPAGAKVWYSTSDNPKRKYPHTWELVETPQGIVSINSSRANALVREAIEVGVIAELSDPSTIKAEAKIPSGEGRFDFLLEHNKVGESSERTYVEVKSTTLDLSTVDGSKTEPGIGAFPDAVSARALKHVAALQACIQQGHRGVLVFCAQHTGIKRVRIAHEIDKKYAAGISAAQANGLEIIVYGCVVDLDDLNAATLRVNKRLDFFQAD